MMRRIGLPTSSTFLSMAIVLACLRATPAHAGPDQLWYFPWHTARQANFVNMKDGLCLDAQKASAGEGTIVQVWACNSQWNQRWLNLNAISGKGWCDYSVDYRGTGYTAPCSDGLWWSISVGDNVPPGSACVDVPAADDVLDQHIQLWDCNWTPAQVWRTGVAAWGESPFWVRSNITGSGINRCWTNRYGQGQGVRLWDCAYDF
jgi:hypothetical protein